MTTVEPPESVPTQPVLPRWGLRDAIGSLLGFVLLTLGVSWGLTSLGVHPVTATLIGTPVGWLSLAGWPLVASRRRGNGPRSDFALRFRVADVGYGLLGALVAFAASAVYVLVYLQVTGRIPTSAVGLAAGHATADWQVLGLAGLALAAAFVEELHFRGMWWSALRRRGLGPWATLLITSALFMLLHLEPQRAPLLFVAGLTAGYVRMVTDRLGSAIATHFVVNGVAALGLLSLLTATP